MHQNWGFLKYTPRNFSEPIFFDSTVLLAICDHSSQIWNFFINRGPNGSPGKMTKMGQNGHFLRAAVRAPMDEKISNLARMVTNGQENTAVEKNKLRKI